MKQAVGPTDNSSVRSSEKQTEQQPRKRMIKRTEIKEDGRKIVFYSFESVDEVKS